jgi:hypothetical protein
MTAVSVRQQKGMLETYWVVSDEALVPAPGSKSVMVLTMNGMSL